MSKRKKALIAFLGNAYFDSRVFNLRNSLSHSGLNVRVVSFNWLEKRSTSEDPAIKVYNLRRRPAVLFYLGFLLRLKMNLLFGKFDYYFAEDVYTLPLVVIFAKIYRGKIFYNSRELYGYLAGLREKGRVQRIIAEIERRFIKYADHVLVTGEMDAEFIRQTYEIEKPVVIRNLPLFTKPESLIDLRKQLNIPEEGLIILYQGVLLEGRGIMPALEAIKDLPNVYFVLLGDGAEREQFESAAKNLDLYDRSFFLGFIPNDKLINYTASADLGLALIENISKSYYYALPNKLFEYIMAGVPVVCSDLPQMTAVVEKYNIGSVVDLNSRNSVRDIIAEISERREELLQLKENCRIAARELNWQNEFNKLKVLLRI